MKAALVAIMVFGAAAGQDIAPGPIAGAATTMSLEAPWIAHISRSDPTRLQLNVRDGAHSSFGTSIALADLEGLSAADIADGKPVTFHLRREAGTIAFSGAFRNGEGSGTLRFDSAPAYWSRLSAMGVENDLTARRVNLIGLVLLDVRSDYIAALRREGAIAPLSDYVGMRALNVRPDVVHELKPLVAGPLKVQDVMALTALGVTPDYVRGMGGVFPSLAPHDLSGLKALDVTADYVRSLREAGARVTTPGEAQSFRALGISPAAVRRTIAGGVSNPGAADVMRMSMRL